MNYEDVPDYMRAILQNFDIDHLLGQADIRAKFILSRKRWPKDIGDKNAVIRDAKRLQSSAAQVCEFIKAGRIDRVAVCAIRLGQAWERIEHAWLVLRDYEKRECGRKSGKKNGMTPAEQKRQFREWNRQIKESGYRSKSQAMAQLRIPRSTYYEYGKVK